MSSFLYKPHINNQTIRIPYNNNLPMSSSPNNLVFRIGSFSTNPSQYSPISILDSYFQSSSNKNFSQIKEDHIDYDHTTSSRKDIHINFIQIISLDKVNRICNCADCFVVFIDLTSAESRDNLKEIFSYFEWHCSLEKKIYVIGVYSSEDAVQEDLAENKVKDMLAEQEKMKTEYFQIQMGNEKQIENVVNGLTDEAVKMKLKKMKDSDSENNGFDDLSGSKCEIW